MSIDHSKVLPKIEQATDELIRHDRIWTRRISEANSPLERSFILRAKSTYDFWKDQSLAAIFVGEGSPHKPEPLCNNARAKIEQAIDSTIQTGPLVK